MNPDTQTFSHRNGETKKPTLTGWYWIRFAATKPIYVAPRPESWHIAFWDASHAPGYEGFSFAGTIIGIYGPIQPPCAIQSEVSK